MLVAKMGHHCGSGAIETADREGGVGQIKGRQGLGHRGGVAKQPYAQPRTKEHGGRQRGCEHGAAAKQCAVRVCNLSNESLSLRDEDAEQSDRMWDVGRITEGKIGEECYKKLPARHVISPSSHVPGRRVVLGAVPIPEGEGRWAGPV